MKINKKWLIMGTAITTMVAPIATVVSCSNSANAANGDKTKEEDNIIVKPDPVSPDTTILTRDNYKDLSTYDNVTNTLTVHQGVIEIGDVFMNGYPNDKNPNIPLPIAHLVLPQTLTTIDANAFSTSWLTTLKLPKSIKTIGDYAFASAPLKKLDFPYGMTTIGNGAFQSAHLTGMKFPNSIKTIGDYAFMASPFQWLDLGTGVSYVGDWSFKHSKLEALFIPDSVRYVGTGAFYRSPLTSLRLSFNMGVIRPDTFTYAKLGTVFTPIKPAKPGQLSKGLPSRKPALYIPTTITSIGARAFEHSLLLKLNIPQNIQYIGDDAFHDSPLTILTFSQNSSLKSIGDRAFAWQQLTKLMLPRGLETIGQEAFSYPAGTPSDQFHATLRTLWVPPSVTTIKKDAFWSIDSSGSRGDTQVWLPNIFIGSWDNRTYWFYWIFGSDKTYYGAIRVMSSQDPKPKQ